MIELLTDARKTVASIVDANAAGITRTDGLGRWVERIVAGTPLPQSKERYYLNVMRRRIAHLEERVRRRNVRTDFDLFEMEALMWAYRELVEKRPNDQDHGT